LDRNERVDVVAAQAHGVWARTGLTREQTDRAAWTVAGDSVAGGPRGVALMLAVAWNSRLPFLPFKIPGVPWLLDRLYGWIADHRRRFPGETPWCVAHPDECVASSSA
jgi:predicted DCC family thiol-disulfide oxidoreductase YuxK